MKKVKRLLKSPSIFDVRLSQEIIVRDWTLADKDKTFIHSYHKKYRAYIGIQICTIKLSSRFIAQPNELPTDIIQYIANQLQLSPLLIVEIPARKATRSEQHNAILVYLKFAKYTKASERHFIKWIEERAHKGYLPDTISTEAETFLLKQQVILPGQSNIKRTVVRICNKVHEATFAKIYATLPETLRKTISDWLTLNEADTRSYFNQLKDYPPAATITSLQLYLGRYRAIADLALEKVEVDFVSSEFIQYFFTLAKQYNARDIKRFNINKRYALMLCFLLESKKILLDYIVQMHDQYITDICRHSRHAYEVHIPLLTATPFRC